ncbi:MAG: Crp/Fnr family transcriptional regulator [Oscillibacter sp.]|nr:Crp/Fnr family transcriptional regulator [Oscillibacter sp.]
MKNGAELDKNPLFEGISQVECEEMLTCFQAVRKRFRVDDLIYDFAGNSVGLIEQGEAVLLRIDEEGVSTVLETLAPGGVFGKTLAFAGSVGDSLEVVCRKPCEVLFLDYTHIFNRCEHACMRHSVLVQNMLRLMADKAQALSRRVDVLSRRSIREKLLCYFRQLANQAGSDTFTLPFSLSTLADYIATDRSAMMRELKHLREQGVVRSNGRQFTIQ